MVSIIFERKERFCGGSQRHEYASRGDNLNKMPVAFSTFLKIFQVCLLCPSRFLGFLQTSIYHTAFAGALSTQGSLHPYPKSGLQFHGETRTNKPHLSLFSKIHVKKNWPCEQRWKTIIARLLDLTEFNPRSSLTDLLCLHTFQSLNRRDTLAQSRPGSKSKSLWTCA